MINRLVFANLVHRPIRSLISVVAIALEVTLILMIVALSYGMLEDSKARQAGIGADVIVQPPGSSNLIGLTGAPLPVKIGEVVRKLPHVETVTPVLWHLNKERNLEVIYGIDLATFNDLRAPFHYLAGGPFQAPDDVIVDDYYAGGHHSKVGDKMQVLNHEFRICGIVSHGRGARRFFQLATLQDLTGSLGKASVFYVKLDDPKNADAVVGEIKAVPGMENYSTISMDEYLSMMKADNLPGFNIFIRTVVAVAMVIGFLVIFQSMYTAVMERTREIGILKSLGASRFYILRVILREALLLAVGGILAGILVSFVSRTVIVQRVPTLRLLPLTGHWVIIATVIAVIGALMGAIYPAVKAARKDPIDALAYE
jgi:putative ABC transport system permease protein